MPEKTSVSSEAQGKSLKPLLVKALVFVASFSWHFIISLIGSILKGSPPSDKEEESHIVIKATDHAGTVPISDDPETKNYRSKIH
tara:strand:- start:4660 stop:4914 length:255 start_codon:yes stop_codon:yes gene_type:complete